MKKPLSGIDLPSPKHTVILNGRAHILLIFIVLHKAHTDA